MCCSFKVQHADGSAAAEGPTSRTSARTSWGSKVPSGSDGIANSSDHGTKSSDHGTKSLGLQRLKHRPTPGTCSYRTLLMRSSETLLSNSCRPRQVPGVGLDLHRPLAPQQDFLVLPNPNSLQEPQGDYGTRRIQEVPKDLEVGSNFLRPRVDSTTCSGRLESDSAHCTDGVPWTFLESESSSQF